MIGLVYTRFASSKEFDVERPLYGVVLFVGFCSVVVGSDVQIVSNPHTVSCGPRVVGIAKRLIDGKPIEQLDLSRAFPKGLGGEHNLDDIRRGFGALGFCTQHVRLDPKSPALPNTPVVVAVTREGKPASHFVLLFGRDEHVIQVIDYPRSPNLVLISQFAEVWDGEGIMVEACISERAIERHLPQALQLALVFFSGLSVVLSLVLWYRLRIR